jgi:hypothetical protein
MPGKQKRAERREAAGAAGKKAEDEGGKQREDSESESDEEGVVAPSSDHAAAEEVRLTNLYDQPALKHAVDDAVVHYLADVGFEEDYHSSNVKLALGFTACALGALAQFAPLPHPKVVPLLAVCAVLYFALSSAMQYIISYVDRDRIMVSKDHRRGLNPNQFYPAIAAASSMPKLELDYTLTLSYLDEAKYRDAAGSSSRSVTFSVAEVFDASGLLLRRPLHRKLRRVVKDFRQIQLAKAS